MVSAVIVILATLFLMSTTYGGLLPGDFYELCPRPLITDIINAKGNRDLRT